MKFSILTTVLFIFFAPVIIKGQGTLQKKKFIDGKVELSVPADFVEMSAADISAKYPNGSQKPSVALSNHDGDVNILIIQSPQPIQPNQMAAYKDFQIATLKKSHPDARWMESGVKTINGKSVGFFKFTSVAIDQSMFNYYFFTDMDGKVLLFTFNYPEKALGKWKDAAENIVLSLKVK